ncbi:amidase [Tabrizicola piscis]|uniref:Amidase n=1 Tax=Tabrizicola piscis TaxID=2494374 RepID=A0A3S8U4Z9_9RHOB|nr:amidase family protein [Tabrizicola piscis]AZL58732.1 amidase [Tabrizicola piscis]
MRPLVVALALLLPFGVQAEEVSARLEAVQTERLRPLDFAPFGEALAAFQPPPGVDSFLMVAGIADIQTAMAAGELTSEAVTLWHLARIQRLDDRLRGMLELNPAALDEARAADARRAAGQSLGPLDGIPVSLKDNVGTAGPMHTTANAEILFDRVAAEDAALVASLRAAGAVIIGKASLSEFAGSLASGYPSGGNGAVGGQGVNPLGPYPTYGSSSGSAISVAAQFAVVSIGTETAGSLVAPAGVMSLVGMKPSAGLVSTEGVVPLIASNDGPGPIARTVQDAALLLAAADTAEVDYAAGLSADALTGVKVGVLLADIADAGMGTEAMTRTAAALVMLGADPAPVTLDVPMDVIQQFFVYLSAGMRYDMMPVVSAHNPSVVTLEDLIAYNKEDPKRRMPFGQDLLEKFAPLTAELTAEDYAKLTTDVHTAMTEAMDAAFAAHGGVEVLVSMANLHSIFYATAGYPAITVPIGRKESGEPVGVTLIGKKGQDAQLLAYAYAFEQATRAHIPANLP